MRLSSISLSEATTPWMGKLEAVLGTDEPYTLNYGGTPGRPPMLYVPIPLSAVRTAISRIAKGRIKPDGDGDGPDPGTRPKLTHVGEAHATVSMGPELPAALGQDPEAELRASGLFDGVGAGVRVKVRHTGEYRWMRASFYKDEADPKGPLLAAEIVEIPDLERIRTALGLSPLPRIPGVDVYIPHVTVGYLPNLNLIHKSYMDKNGASSFER